LSEKIRDGIDIFFSFCASGAVEQDLLEKADSWESGPKGRWVSTFISMFRLLSVT
jgi:hypothetical protein